MPGIDLENWRSNRIGQGPESTGPPAKMEVKVQGSAGQGGKLFRSRSGAASHQEIWQYLLPLIVEVEENCSSMSKTPH